MLSRGALTSDRLAVIARGCGGQHETREHAVRRTEARRLTLAIPGIDRQLADNMRQLDGLVTEVAPRLLAKRGVGTVSDAQAIVSWSHSGRVAQGNKCVNGHVNADEPNMPELTR